MLEKTFAVIDLETTGNNHRHDHIIQISVVFVKHKKIVETFTRFLSDANAIPIFVQELTQIDMVHLEDKPKFSDIAMELYKKLEDCVIVAHNVNFDLNFLKAEFENHGLSFKPEWALDTVEMSQIVFPQIEKFQLNRVASELGIPLKNAHRADEDAEATAKILIKIIHKLLNLNREIIYQLYHESRYLKFDFNRLLLSIYETEANTGADYYEQYESLYIKGWHRDDTHVYPLDIKEAYAKYIAYHNYEYRSVQFNIIHDVYEKFMTNENIAIEAYTGAGKTSAYLIAAICFYANTGQSVIISTSKKVLQNELFQNSLAHVLESLEMTIPFVSLKGQSNYINLDAVLYLLEQDTINNDVTTLKMKLLIWLAETYTGDLDEINLKTTEKIYYDLANIHKSRRSNYHFNNQAKHIKDTGLIITNHYYLEDITQLFLERRHLLIDEAHQLNDALIERHKKTYRYSSLKFMLNQIGTVSDDKMLAQLFYNSDDVSYYLLEDLVEQLSMNTHDIFEAFHKNQLDAVIRHINASRPLARQFIDVIAALDNSQMLHNHMTFFLRAMEDMLHGIMEQRIEIERGKHLQQVKVIIMNHQKVDFNMIFSHIESLILLSGTLEINNAFRHLEPLFIGKTYDTKIYANESLFDETMLFVPNDIPALDNLDAFIEMMVEYIALYVTETNNKLVVFMTSYEAIELASEYLEEITGLDDYVILKQTKQLSATKLLNSFKEMSQCILLVTSGFTEGIDFEFGKEKMLMIQKLPFQRFNHKSDFYEDELPRTVFQFRQMIGRLTRGDNGRGMVVVFDKRILFSNYKRAFLKYFKHENITHSSIDSFKNMIDDL